MFVAIHLVRLDRLLVNADGVNYLASALRISDGHLPYPRYSPGFAVALAPLAALLNGRPHLLRLAAGSVNIVVAVAALLLVQRFLRGYLSATTATMLVAVFALGETATNVLVGTEVEPISLLLVALTLVALQEDRPWVAVVATAVAGMTRVALVPWFGVLWLLRARRTPRPAGAAIGLLAGDVVTYLVLSRQGGYAGIASQSYTQGNDRSPFAGLLEIVPDHLVRYGRLGAPSAFWPSDLLTTPPGYVLGAATTLCALIWGRMILQRTSGTFVVDEVGRAAILGAAAYAVLLWFWPANDGAVLRLSTPMAPVMLLVTVVGAGAVARRLWSARWRQLVAVGLAGALALGLAASIGLAAQRRTSEAPVRDFVTTTGRGLRQSSPGPIVSNASAITQVVTGRPVEAIDRGATAAEVLRLAARSRACAVVITQIVDGYVGRLGSSLLQDDRVRRTAASKDTQVFVLDEPWCS